MIFSIVALGVSFVAMTAMVMARVYEINLGQKVIAVPARIWCDKHLQMTVRSLRVIVQVASTKKFWTGLSTFIGQKFVEKVWHHPHVEKVTKKAVDVVRGKKEIKSSGPVSFYLKDVGSYKKEMPS